MDQVGGELSLSSAPIARKPYRKLGPTAVRDVINVIEINTFFFVREMYKRVITAGITQKKFLDRAKVMLY